MQQVSFILSFLIFLLTTILYFFINKRKNDEKRSKLPPGSMGWPYIGQTLQFYTQHPNTFFFGKQIRYGEIFKTHVLGCPCGMLASPEAAKFVSTSSEAHLFKPTYPKTKETLIGPSALFFHQGDYHTRLRKLVQGPLYPEAIRNMVGDIEALIVSAFNSFADGRVVNTFHEMKKLSFEVGILAIFGNLDIHYKEELKKNYSIVDRGYNSLPINISGTRYRKAIKARKTLSKILGEIIKEKKASKVMEKGLLSCLMSNSNDENLSEDQIEDNIIGVLFAAQDTTASAITWIIKYLSENPKVLRTVKAEQKKICESHDNYIGTCNLTWNQTRNMPFTSKVIYESLRVSSIISFLFREAVTDVQYKGYLIPKGWKVMPLLRNIHHNPDFFPDPQQFDPTRFENGAKANTFMPFGIGKHACPGNELAKLEMLILVHHLASHYRYNVSSGSESGIQYAPFLIPSNGPPAQFWKDEML